MQTITTERIRKHSGEFMAGGPRGNFEISPISRRRRWEIYDSSLERVLGVHQILFPQKYSIPGHKPSSFFIAIAQNQGIKSKKRKYSFWHEARAALWLERLRLPAAPRIAH